ncbi:hypothetical protein AGMMS49532_03830 [Endomicrobiia bacterium]|nr:hypothetical protein [Candidatus Endomicrobium trichonymphae]GHT08529.1 hypothetical protein AGMMS49532_03830 [Endomicrobiia bacterium]
MLADRYVKIDYKSYEDFIENCKINVPENFNFAFDVVDETAYISPDKKAMVWCNPEGEEKVFTFNDIRRESNRVANFLNLLG